MTTQNAAYPLGTHVKDDLVANLRHLIEQSQRAQQRSRECRQRAEELTVHSERLFTEAGQLHQRSVGRIANSRPEKPYELGRSKSDGMQS